MPDEVDCCPPSIVEVPQTGEQVELPSPNAGKNWGTPARSRVTVVETVSFESPSRRPWQASLPHSRWVEGDEQPFEREGVAMEQWQKLEIGWIKRASMLKIVNRGKAVLEVCVSAAPGEPLPTTVIEADLLVYPFDSMRVTPANLDRITVRGSGRYDLVLLPG